MRNFSAVVAIGLLGASAIPSRAESPVPSSFTVISPVFGQLVRYSMPAKIRHGVREHRGEFLYS
ncbi:hypothetical protein [Bradyrhizobium lablabi]|uniref:hypothetical protein n=1 Tax=Bradyrhizobium lablabi TaxID=722472 RepID=UPI001FCD9EDE|nr:hypothetical protein [Bradyrhizobium lablabi]